MARPVYLLDVNLLIALADSDHPQHRSIAHWCSAPGLEFAVCTLTEAGFIRLAMNPVVIQGAWAAHEAVEFLETLALVPGYHFWPLSVDWRSLILPLLPNIQGHNQIPDAYLLGLAMLNDGVLATTDKRLRSLAGSRNMQHLVVLEE